MEEIHDIAVAFSKLLENLGDLPQLLPWILLPSILITAILLKILLWPVCAAKSQNFPGRKCFAIHFLVLSMILLIGVVWFSSKYCPQAMASLSMFLASVLIVLIVITLLKFFFWPIDIAKARQLSIEKVIAVYVSTWCSLFFLGITHLALGLFMLLSIHIFPITSVFVAAAFVLATLLSGGLWFVALCLSVFFKNNPQS